VGANQNHKQPQRRRPLPEFWIKAGFVASFLVHLFPDWLALAIGVLVLLSPARLFRP
jgi:hypothetical protein